MCHDTLLGHVRGGPTSPSRFHREHHPRAMVLSREAYLVRFTRRQSHCCRRVGPRLPPELAYVGPAASITAQHRCSSWIHVDVMSNGSAGAIEKHTLEPSLVRFLALGLCIGKRRGPRQLLKSQPHLHFGDQCRSWLLLIADAADALSATGDHVDHPRLKKAGVGVKLSMGLAFHPALG